jgi:hypothetical protein
VYRFGIFCNKLGLKPETSFYSTFFKLSRTGSHFLVLAHIFSFMLTFPHYCLHFLIFALTFSMLTALPHLDSQFCMLHNTLLCLLILSQFYMLHNIMFAFFPSCLLTVNLFFLSSLIPSCGLYYKNIKIIKMTIISDAPSCGIICDCHSDDLSHHLCS